MTPMLLQYFRVKEENPGCILFFRVGDFFETYGEDAEISSRELEITLTSKDSGEGNKIPMAGVPFFAVDQYLNSLVKKGYRIALCDQVEDPKKAKGLVKRKVVRIISSGTLTDPTLLDSSQNNYLAVFYMRENKASLALCDISTGDFFVSELKTTQENALKSELQRWNPSEIILDTVFSNNDEVINYIVNENIPYRFTEILQTEQESIELLKKCFNLSSISNLEISVSSHALIASAHLIEYLYETQKNNFISIKQPVFYKKSDYAYIDPVSMRNLELTETIVARERKGSLLWAIDATLTSMGSRLLRSFVTAPLIDKEKIEDRLDAVTELIGAWNTLTSLRGLLKNIGDIERLLAKVVFKSANARDIKALGKSLSVLPEIKKILSGCQTPLLKKLSLLEPLTDLSDYIDNSILDEPPATLRDGGMISDLFSEELCELRNISRSGKKYIVALEESEREKTGIKSLKIGFNQVFGYYIEVTKTNLKNVPEHYIRKQTISNGERYITEELKSYEAKILGAQERIKALEFILFEEVRTEVLKYADRLRDTSTSLALADVLSSFALTASTYSYTRPLISETPLLNIKEGRHPVAERIMSSVFVKNDLFLDPQNTLCIITGPNMAGKSTYLRQNALIAILAQIGSFVPAKEAEIGIADKFFTRVGATDDLHLGQSTFMVEMLETANILNNATARSIVILDEIGRGTSTYDGMSIARAVIESLACDNKSRTLFATHFHELTSMDKLYPSISNLRVAVRENEGDVVFLHRILKGAADKSYGIYVASLAGFPEKVLSRAQEILKILETTKNTDDYAMCEHKPSNSGSGQLTFFESKSIHPVISEIRKLNIMEMTPLEALNKLYKWQISIDKFIGE